MPGHSPAPAPTVPEQANGVPIKVALETVNDSPPVRLLSDVAKERRPGAIGRVFYRPSFVTD